MPNYPRLGRIAFNYLLPLVVTVFVGWYFFDKLRDPKLREHSFQLRWEWLVPAGLLYLVAHTIWASYWVTLLHNQKVQVTWSRGVFAYFISQFGKYVPGKVWVIVIRINMLGRQGIDKATVGVTATFEALTSMAAGAFLGGLLLAVLAIDRSGLGGKVYFLIPLALMPLGVRALNRLVARIAEKRRGPDAAAWPKVGFGMMLRGGCQACLGWCILGISLWMTICGLNPTDIPWDWEQLGRLTAINCLAYVAGFLFLFMPAGAGVREAFLQMLLAIELQAQWGETAAGFAAVIAIVLRLLWTVFELLCAGVLYLLVPSPEVAIAQPHRTGIAV